MNSLAPQETSYFMVNLLFTKKDCSALMQVERKSYYVSSPVGSPGSKLLGGETTGYKFS